MDNYHINQAILNSIGGNTMLLGPYIDNDCWRCGNTGEVETDEYGFFDYAAELFRLGYSLKDVSKKWHYYHKTGLVNCSDCNYGY